MKKLIFITLLMLLFPGVSFAISGACSWHNGVNCSLSNATTSIICNDGSSDSSTSYNNLSECQNVRCDVNSVTAFEINRGLGGSNIGSSLIQRCEDFNRSLDDTISNGYINYLPISTDNLLDIKMQQFCIDTYGINSYNDSVNKKCECNIGYIKNPSNNFKCEPEEDVKQSQDNYIQQKMQEYCVNHYGSNSIYNDLKTCACNPGYVFDENIQCSPEKEVYDNYCKKQFGENSYSKDDKCFCLDGYSYDDTSKTCKLLEVKQEVIQPIVVPKEPVKNIVPIIKKDDLKPVVIKEQPFGELYPSTNTSGSEIENYMTVKPKDDISTPVKQSFFQRVGNFFKRFKFW